MSHKTALNAILRVRYLYSRIPWESLSLAEQRDVQMNTRLGRGAVDRERLAGLHLLEDITEPVDITVGSSENRTRRPDVICHLVSKPLPARSILKVANGVYCVSPETALFQCAGDFSFPELFILMMELLGSYALSHGADFNSENDRGRSAVFGCDPAVTVNSLLAIAKLSKNTRAYGFHACIPYLQEGAASPMESVLYAMLALPHRYGGFNCFRLPGGMMLNHRIEFNDLARRLSSQMPYAVCDCYIPSAKIDLEYNGSYHEERSMRLHDGNRNNGLKGMGITVFVINKEQAQDIAALEAIARHIYAAAGVRFRYQVKGYFALQRNLLANVRRASGIM